MLGFPIRKSSDLSSVDSSPRLIAASYVLHRLLVPRHPPYALTHLQTKMLASTVQFSNNTPTRIRNSKPARAKTLRYSRRSEQVYFLPGKNVCSFRTQQCVDYIRHPKHIVFEQPPAHVSVPPMSSSRTTHESETVSARRRSDSSDPCLEKCSLERR